jgi:CheY-like chemotaxis protein
MRKVLLVDDDQEDAVILKLGLEEAKLDIAIMHAPDACTMFDLLNADRPAIIFMDLHMPCEDGLSCLESIRSNPHYDDIPIVIYSGDNNNQTIQQAFARGADLFLPKPLSISRLSIELQQLFSRELASLRSKK